MERTVSECRKHPVANAVAMQAAASQNRRSINRVQRERSGCVDRCIVWIRPTSASTRDQGALLGQVPVCLIGWNDELKEFVRFQEFEAQQKKAQPSGGS
jgi:hypothetical protein